RRSPYGAKPPRRRRCHVASRLQNPRCVSRRSECAPRHGQDPSKSRYPSRTPGLLFTLPSRALRWSLTDVLTTATERPLASSPLRSFNPSRLVLVDLEPRELGSKWVS